MSLQSREWSKYAATFCVSAAILCLELCHMRILSVTMWQSLVYCVITVALLGFGVSGAFLSVWRGAFTIRQDVLLTTSTVGFAISNLAACYVGGKLGVDAFRLVSEPGVLVPLFAYFILLAVPYFAGGLTIGIVLARNPGQTTRLYCANMVGAGAGCILFLLLIMPLGAPRVLLVMSALSAVAALLFALPTWRTGVAVSVALAIAIGALVPVADELYAFKVCESKHYSRELNANPDTHVVYRRWTPTGRIDVLAGSKLIFHNPHTGLDFPYHLVLTDCDANTRLFHYPQDRSGPFIPFDKTALNAAYSLIEKPEVLIIGLGAAKEIWEGLGLGASAITAVEFNPAILELVRTVYADTLGRPAERPEATVIHAEGRSYVHSCADQSFDMVYMNGVDTFAALSSGAYTMAENYLYTAEAFREYFRVLRPDGILSVSQVAFRVPREMMRLVVTAADALREHGVSEPWRHLIVLEEYGWGTVIARKSPFTRRDVQVIERLARNTPYHIVYRPGLEDKPLSEKSLRLYGRGFAEPAPFGSALNPVVAYMQAVKNDTDGSFCKNYVYDVRPVSDDNPFFFRFHKWTRLLGEKGRGVEWDVFGGSIALVVMLSLFMGACVAVVSLIFVPLVVSSKRKGDLSVTPGAVRYGIFFVCLGVGFMFVEISLMQKFTLYLGHPSYAISTVLSTILIFSGMGSLCSGFVSWSYRRLVVASVGGLCLLILLYTFGLDKVLPGLLSFGAVTRNLLGAAIIAPLAFLMGVPFPTGLKAVRRKAETFIPWAWGVNGAAGVLASVASVMIAIHAGFNLVLLLAAAIYLFGSVVVMRDLSGSAIHSAVQETEPATL